MHILIPILAAIAGIAIGYLVSAQRTKALETELRLGAQRLSDAQHAHERQLTELKNGHARQTANAASPSKTIFAASNPMAQSAES